MNCFICGNHLIDYGNNPFPMCHKDDYESRCCDMRDTFVIKARIMSVMQKKSSIVEGDSVIIFYSKNSTNPIDSLRDEGKFLIGVVDKISQENDDIVYEGSWGNFKVFSNSDQFIRL